MLGRITGRLELEGCCSTPLNRPNHWSKRLIFQMSSFRSLERQVPASQRAELKPYSCMTWSQLSSCKPCEILWGTPSIRIQQEVLDWAKLVQVLGSSAASTGNKLMDSWVSKSKSFKCWHFFNTRTRVLMGYRVYGDVGKASFQMWGLRHSHRDQIQNSSVIAASTTCKFDGSN